MRSNGIKISITIFIILMISFFYKAEVHAIAKNDCGIITGSIPLFQHHTIGDKEISFEEIFPYESLEKAILHLNRYCCNEKLLKEDNKLCENINTRVEKGPQSPFLFDHLMDVGLRRLDTLNNYGLEGDPMSIRRKQELSGFMHDPEGVIASKIIESYKKYRTLNSKNMFKKIHLNIQKFEVDEVGKLEDYIKNYDIEKEVSIVDKYNNICFIARNMYEKKPTDKILIGTDKLTKGRSYYTDCQKMVASRIQKESTLTKTVIIEQSTKILMENINQTINKHFVQDKLMKLQETIINIRDLFTTLVKQAPVSKKCTN